MGEPMQTAGLKPGSDAFTLLDDIESRFRSLAGDDEQIDLDELQQGLGLKDRDYAQRIFNLVDKDGGGTVSLWEFIEFAKVLTTGSADEKLRIIFDLHDLNGDGTVDPKELTHILDRSLNEHQIDISSEKLEALSAALFASVDTDGSGAISFAEFKAAIDSHPALRDQMIATSANWLKLPQRIPADRRQPGRKLRALVGAAARLWDNNRPWIVLLALYVFGTGWMFWHGMAKEAAIGSDLATQIAQGAAHALKLNVLLVLVAMLRQTLTFLRRTPLGPFLPLDQAIAFHKIVGHACFILALIHIGGYIAAYEAMVDPTFFTRATVYGGLIKSRVGWTGVTVILVFLTMWVCSLEAVRRKGLFELFYWTHQLYWVLLAILIAHFPGFWMWIVVPGVWFVAEQLLRVIRGRRVAEANALTAVTDQVTRLSMHRPDWFKYEAGEYVFLRHPAISKREWHPFTVTSNPEQQESLELHVRSVGTWTHRLHRLAVTAPAERPENWPKVYLDGPYGSPASDIFDSSVPVLIGAGIGVTPFASILRSILHRRRTADGSLKRLQKVYFIWMNRSHQAFEWFVDLMRELEEDPSTTDIVDVQIYLTGLSAGLTSASLTVAMEVYHEETGRDLLTGLKAPTRLSRPDWQSVFQRIRNDNPDTPIDVYYCGPEGLSRSLARDAGRFGFGYKKENF